MKIATRIGAAFFLAMMAGGCTENLKEGSGATTGETDSTTEGTSEPTSSGTSPTTGTTGSTSSGTTGDPTTGGSSTSSETGTDGGSTSSSTTGDPTTATGETSGTTEGGCEEAISCADVLGDMQGMDGVQFCQNPELFPDGPNGALDLEGIVKASLLRWPNGSSCLGQWPWASQGKLFEQVCADLSEDGQQFCDLLMAVPEAPALCGEDREDFAAFLEEVGGGLVYLFSSVEAPETLVVSKNGADLKVGEFDACGTIDAEHGLGGLTAEIVDEGEQPVGLLLQTWLSTFPNAKADTSQGQGSMMFPGDGFQSLFTNMFVKADTGELTGSGHLTLSSESHPAFWVGPALPFEVQ